MRRAVLFIAFCIFMVLSPGIHGQNAGLEFENQVSTWLGMNFPEEVKWQSGIRYIPTISPWIKAGANGKFDAEFSANTFGSVHFTGSNYDSAYFRFKPYRLWMRYSTSHLEIRAGLQKINFGSSTILRPLMWFDKMDFRDPLMLTDGVYALLGRYYFSNNANIWLWGLYGNDKTKGWEAMPSLEEIPEYGGRVQLPVPGGEFALSYHHRDADYSALAVQIPGLNDTRYNEQLFAADGKWDIGPGIWFEMVGKLNEKENPFTTRWESYLSLGMDYTFGIGKGLNVSTEYFRYQNHPGEGETRAERNISTLTLGYPIGLSHNISGMLYYNWDTDDWYRFINLQMKYDYLTFYLMTYWNPDDAVLYTSGEGGNSFSGKGFQLMFVFDF
ncbi:MAG: hypothetical protein MUE37_03160 [Bacteroidales bacterium]|jgi:hypothetical protein|nr:hypothetical protein [Bacteroidales bacterium]